MRRGAGAGRDGEGEVGARCCLSVSLEPEIHSLISVKDRGEDFKTAEVVINGKIIDDATAVNRFTTSDAESMMDTNT